MQLLDEHKLARGLDADSEDYLVLGQAEDLAVLDLAKSLSIDELAGELGQILVVPHHQFPERLHILEPRQLLCC